MAGVVFLHTLPFAAAFHKSPESLLKLDYFYLLAKFSTIGFFLVSGFLMGSGLHRHDPVRYMTRRLQTVFLPWLFWFLIYAGIQLTYMRAQLLAQHFSVFWTASQLTRIMFETTYWFVPNLIFAQIILLACRRFLNSLRFGAALGVISLLHGAYLHWISHTPDGHTGAFFGFIFYLWLGSYAAEHHEALQQKMERIPAYALLLATLLTFVLSLVEVYVLVGRLGVTPLMNTLRIGNQLYSVSMVLLLYKFRRSFAPSWLNVRATTFGIYLLHPYLIFFFRMYVTRLLGHFLPSVDLTTDSPLLLCGIYLACFAVVYAGSTFFSSLLSRFRRLRWSVGMFPKPVRQPDLVAAG